MRLLPPIETWWPTLPAPLKQKVLRDLDAPLSPDIIEAVLGESRPDDYLDGADDGYDIIRLTPRERDFVRTQVETVD